MGIFHQFELHIFIIFKKEDLRRRFESSTNLWALRNMWAFEVWIACVITDKDSLTTYACIFWFKLTIFMHFNYLQYNLFSNKNTVKTALKLKSITHICLWKQENPLLIVNHYIFFAINIVTVGANSNLNKAFQSINTFCFYKHICLSRNF